MSEISKAELFIFDWSGVISDDRQPVFAAGKTLLKKYAGLDITFEEWLPKTCLSFLDFMTDHVVTHDPIVLQQDYVLHLEQAKNNGTPTVVYSDADLVLAALHERNKRLVVVSSHPEESLHAEAREYGLDKYFSAILGDTRDKSKRIREVCEGNNIYPRNAVYAGDTVYDIQAAKKAGVMSVGITTGYHVRERLMAENPDLLVDSLTELISFIK